jgi:serine/threonine protein phosphatase PrpC
LKRDGNEDCFVADGSLGLWLVADGVGGHSCGEVAAAIVAATVTEEVARGQPLATAIHQAHAEVLREIAGRDTNTRMGSTVVAVLLADADYTLAWVGDSRAYLWDGITLLQLTRDHSHVRDLVDRGMLANEDIKSHPERHALTQSIGVSLDMQLNLGQALGQLEAGQQMLLCSDGLTDELPDSEIAQQLRHHSSTQAQVDGLINAALRAGGRDNVTAVIVGAPADASQLADKGGIAPAVLKRWLLAVTALAAIGLLLLIAL